MAVNSSFAADTPPPIEWEQSFGGTRDDLIWNSAALSDGGFLLIGTSNSGATANKTSRTHGKWDAWIVRVDANGNKLWERSLGGNEADGFESIVSTGDGGFLLGGSGGSAGGLWLVKVDADGGQIWESGGWGSSVLNMVQTHDGGYLLDVRLTTLAKVDANGNLIWEIPYPFGFFGGTGALGGGVLASTGDGGFLLGGRNTTEAGDWDFWVVKLAGSPRIALKMSAGTVRLSWPLFAWDYAVEQTRALASPPATITWSEIPGPYESDGNVNFVTLPAPTGD